MYLIEYESMSRQEVNPQEIQAEALKQFNQLKRVTEKATEGERRYYSPLIQAVWVFSGPGTYYDRLKPGQEEYQRWMDRDRIRAGVAVVCEVTAAKKYHQQTVVQKTKTDPVTKPETKKEVPFRGCDMTKDDIAEHGPLFVYNGTPLENEKIREALKSEYCKLPPEKVLLIDEVKRPDSVFAIRHTGDQFESFFQEMANPYSPLHKVIHVVLVAHAPDFIRHPFYAEKYNEENGYPIRFWAYALRSRKDTEQLHLEAELPRLVTYANRGDLARKPAQMLF